MLKNKVIILVLLIFGLVKGYAQNDTTQVKELKWLYRAKGSPYDFPPSVSESTISIVPEIQGGKNFFFGIGVSKDKYNFYRKGITTGHNWMVGLEYSPFNQIFAPKLSYTRTAAVANFRLNTILYLSKEQMVFAARPEIGFGVYRFQTGLGRNIFLNKNEMVGLNKWNFSLYYYFLILPKHKKA